MSLCVNICKTILEDQSHFPGRYFCNLFSSSSSLQTMCNHLAKIFGRSSFPERYFYSLFQNSSETHSWTFKTPGSLNLKSVEIFLACLDHTLRNSCPVGRFEQGLLLIQCCYVSALFIWPARKICSSRHKIFFNTTNSPLRGISVAAICIKMRSWVHREIWNLCF